MTYTRHDTTYGHAARDRIDEAATPGLPGALAALETFYHAFNNRGPRGVLPGLGSPRPHPPQQPPRRDHRGHRTDQRPLRRDLQRSGRRRVEFHDIVIYDMGDAVVFVGRERGEFAKAG